MNEADREDKQTTPPTDQQDDQSLPIDPDETESEDEVEEASDESFPASDPPSFTRSTAAD
jgi:hypothetical protein